MIAANARGVHKAGNDPRVRWIDGGATSALAIAPGVIDLHWLPYARTSGLGRSCAAPVLARYLDCRTEEIEFVLEPRGRPRLAGPRAPLDFSLAHSGDRMILAVGWGRFGVDLEVLDPRRDYLALARHQFEGSELALVESLPADQRGFAFLRLWTAKEALVKSLGCGLAAMSDVRLAEEHGALVPTILPPEADDPACWSLYECSPEPGYQAMLALSSAPRVDLRATRSEPVDPRAS
jgi:4'-phosphopantetheinyl transferase